MHSSFPVDESLSSNSDFLHRYARRMLRAARSTHTSVALPVVRRVYTAGILPWPRLADLYRERNTLQLKHMFRTLAIELGYAAWDECKRDVNRRSPDVLDRFRMDLGEFGDYNRIWFSDEASARRWQSENGGHVVVYGNQAAVMTK